ncbi:MAG: dimethylsulfide dehydrogenase [Proteobacteria bacterium]|nr:dimethylsulfide dehydrogenase [Pseudomonadota bacterium]
MNRALMNKTLLILLLSLLAACTESVVVVDDTPVQALQAGGTVSLQHKAGANFGSPDDPDWRDVQEYSMDLNLAPPVHASINLRYDPATPAVPVNLRAASDGQSLFLRMRWPDATQNTTTSRDEFADGIAIQFAQEGGDTTSYMMGAAATPVNIWYWKAGTDLPQNLAAGGFGSTTLLERGELTASNTFRNSGEWVVVFSRPLSQEGDHQVDLNSDSVLIALALWQGDKRQRDGLKHVSPGWITLK